MREAYLREEELDKRNILAVYAGASATLSGDKKFIDSLTTSSYTKPKTTSTAKSNVDYADEARRFMAAVRSLK